MCAVGPEWLDIPSRVEATGLIVDLRLLDQVHPALHRRESPERHDHESERFLILVDLDERLLGPVGIQADERTDLLGVQPVMEDPVARSQQRVEAINILSKFVNLPLDLDGLRPLVASDHPRQRLHPTDLLQQLCD